MRTATSEGRMTRPIKQNNSQAFSNSHSFVAFMGATKLPIVSPAATMRNKQHVCTENPASFSVTFSTPELRLLCGCFVLFPAQRNLTVNKRKRLLT